MPFWRSDASPWPRRRGNLAQLAPPDPYFRRKPGLRFVHRAERPQAKGIMLGLPIRTFPETPT